MGLFGGKTVVAREIQPVTRAGAAARQRELELEAEDAAEAAFEAERAIPWWKL